MLERGTNLARMHAELPDEASGALANLLKGMKTVIVKVRYFENLDLARGNAS